MASAMLWLMSSTERIARWVGNEANKPEPMTPVIMAAIVSAVIAMPFLLLRN